MPKFDPAGSIARSFEATPGRWLVTINRKVELKNTGERPGIETIDPKTGAPRASKGGVEMWSVVADVIDDHPDAPNGGRVFFNLLWGGKGRDATYALLARLGWPVEQWKRETDPAKCPDITPEYFYDRLFVLDCAVTENGYLEPNGFMPYFAATAQRGPAGGGGGGSSGAKGRGKAAGAAPANGTAPASAAPKSSALPF